MSRFLEEMLRSVDPSQVLGREVTIRYVLDEAVKKIDESALEEQPEVEASLRMTLGETYLALGLYDAAEVNLRAAEAIRSRLLGDEHRDTLSTDRALAGLLRFKGRFAEAEALLRGTARTQRRVLGEEHPDTLATLNELALALRGPGRYEEAESIHRQILTIQRRVLGEHAPETVISLGHLGADCCALDKIDEAENLLVRALERCRSILGEEHPFTAEVMNNLGQLREDQGDHERAEILYRDTYQLNRRILGPDHPRTLIPLNNLLRILQGRGDTEAIRPLAAERIAHLKRAAQRAELRPDATSLAHHAYAWELLNCELIDLRDSDRALPVAQRAVELSGGRDANSLETLALAYRMTGNLELAIETQRRAITVAQSGGLYDRARMESRLRDYLLENGELAEAFNVSWARLTVGLSDWVLPEGLLQPSDIPDKELINQSESLMEERRFIEAAAVLRGCLAMRRKALPQGHWLISDAKSRLGGAIAGEGKFVEAEPLLLESYTALSRAPLVSVDYKRQAIERIIRLYESWEKPEQASEWRQRLESEPP
jgi:tetratricopeptide (TPR) repeat protein